MTALASDAQRWSPKRWIVSIAIVIAIHLVLLAALGNGSPQQVQRTPPIHVAIPGKVLQEIQALTDPTLLAMGGPHGFSSIWMPAHEPPPVNANYEEPPRWLPLDSSQLGGGFVDFARSNATPLHGLTFKTSPQPMPGETSPVIKPVRSESTLRVTGELSGRRMLNAPDLPPQIATDLLTHSEVRVVVDSRGLVTSAILLPPGSGSREADRFAVEQAQRIRFAPLHPPGATPALTLGRLIFDWQTLPPAATTNDFRD